MGHDEDFAQALRDRAHAVAPHIAVDTGRVVPRARRRRAVARGAGSLALAAVMAGGGWVAQAQPWSTAAPGTTALPVGGGAPETPSAGPTATAVAPPTVEEPFWYTLAQISSADGTRSEQAESWLSRELPGLLVTDGDLATATGVGPRDVVGRFFLDGAWVDMLRDPTALPTDAAALEGVLRASVEPDRRSGTDDEKVFGMARDLLLDGGLLPVELRRAAWDVAAGLPGVTVTDGSDSTGRAGSVLAYPTGGSVSTLVADPLTGLLLEQSTGDGFTTYLEQGSVVAPPVEPTLDNAGCVSWATC
ncbi:MAG TPA: hypothetical protein PLS68_10660 [Actinotalea sp.]|nr:hypothetical protein [Actinotalea sp.]